MMMEGQGQGQRQKQGGRRRRKGKGKTKAKSSPAAKEAPVLIAARRPNSPLIAKVKGRVIAASAAPKPEKGATAQTGSPLATQAAVARVDRGPQRRAARIVQSNTAELDEREQLRERLLERLVGSQGRGAISKAANDLWENDFDVPREQTVQIQLLEHESEERARDAIAVMLDLVEQEEPIKRPVLDQRLRRIEEHADEDTTREAAAELRRVIRA